MTSAVALLIATAQLIAQQSVAPQQAPKFRAGVDVVAVDFLAIDGEGRPLADLNVGELTLKVDGKPREIRSLQFVRVGNGTTPRPSSPATITSLQPFADNQSAEPVETPSGTPRSVVFVANYEHIGSSNARVVADIVEHFLDKMSAGDRAAIVTMPNGRVEVDLTPDLARVRKTAASLAAFASKSLGDYNVGMVEAITVARSPDPKNEPIVLEISDLACRLMRDSDYTQCMERTKAAVVAQSLRMFNEFQTSTRGLMTSLVNFLAGLAGVDGPKTVVLISEGFAPFPETLQDLRDVTVAAGRSRVQLYVIQPYVSALQDASSKLAPRSYREDLELQLSGLQDLSAATGGSLLRLSGTPGTAIARIERETSAYYLLGFEPTPSERDGKSHKIDVRVQRSNVGVRARPEFTIPKTTNPAAADAPANVAPVTTPNQMIRDDKQYRDLPMRALAYPFRSPDKTSVKVIAIVESPEPSTRFSAVAFSLAESSGKTIAEWTADSNQLSASQLVSATMVPPGDYRLRVAATDARGRLGAVNYDFSAGLVAAGSLQVGGLMLGVTSTSGTFAPRLLFGAADEDATGYFEVYGTAAATGVTVAWELADSKDGPAIVTATGDVSPTTEPDRFIARGVLPIISLTRGDYSVRAIVSANGQVIGRLSRPLRKQ